MRTWDSGWRNYESGRRWHAQRVRMYLGSGWRKVKKVTGQCKKCLKGKHHYGRHVRGCQCGCSTIRDQAL